LRVQTSVISCVVTSLLWASPGATSGSASAQINRGDYDIKFNAALGSGNLVVSDKVKILVEVSAVQQA
jgi:polyisoprenoid-binding protein YceI